MISSPKAARGAAAGQEPGHPRVLEDDPIGLTGKDSKFPPPASLRGAHTEQDSRLKMRGVISLSLPPSSGCSEREGASGSGFGRPGGWWGGSGR